MPTYLTHESSPVYTSNTDYLDLDPNNTLSLGKKTHAPSTTNGETHQLALGKHNPCNPHDSFDESSLSSVQASDVSDSAPTQMNGTRPTSMSSLPNGRAADGGGHDDLDASNESTGAGTLKARAPQNGYVKMPERLAPPPPVMNGSATTVNGVPSRPTDTLPIRTSVGSASAITTSHGSSLELAQSTRRDTDSAPQQLDGSPYPSDTAWPSQHTQGALPSTSGPATTSTISLSSDPRARTSPHRLSSPPMYQTTSASQATLSSLQVPPNAGLKQRHTLEVPKVQPIGRNSKDGADSAFASGRFSPTTATAGVRRASLSLARRNTRSLQSEGPRDEIVPDEDALRWAEAYRQKRASKRKKREEEDDDRVLVGTKVDEHHANWVTAYNMLTGIRVSVSRTNAKLDRPLTTEDFQAKQKSTFDM